jgi:hypothetical protein
MIVKQAKAGRIPSLRIGTCLRSRNGCETGGKFPGGLLVTLLFDQKHQQIAGEGLPVARDAAAV